MNNPELYEREDVKSIAQMLIDEHVPLMVGKMSWKPFESILDYGCGAGSILSRFLLPQAEKYSSALTGVDISPEMIAYANENYPHVLVNFMVGDIMVKDPFKWPCRNMKFDKIFVVHVVHFIQEYEEFFRRLAEHLAPGGQLAVGTPFAKFQRIHHNLGDSPKWRKYMGIMKTVRASWPFDENVDFPSSVQSILDSLHLKILDFYTYEAKHTYPSVDSFIDFIIATNKGAKNVPQELQPELRQEIGKQAAEIMGVPVQTKPFIVSLNYLRFVVEKPQQH